MLRLYPFSYIISDLFHTIIIKILPLCPEFGHRTGQKFYGYFEEEEKKALYNKKHTNSATDTSIIWLDLEDKIFSRL